VEASGQLFIQTSLISPVLKGLRCLHFWYHQNVTPSHGLTVFTRKIIGSTSALDDKVPVWHLKGGYGDKWQHGTVPILLSTQPYQVRVSIKKLECTRKMLTR